MSLPCGREKCIGKSCGNFGDKGCKGGEYPPWSWSKWYGDELPKITERVYREREEQSKQKEIVRNCDIYRTSKEVLKHYLDYCDSNDGTNMSIIDWMLTEKKGDTNES